LETLQLAFVSLVTGLYWWASCTLPSAVSHELWGGYR